MKTAEVRIAEIFWSEIVQNIRLNEGKAAFEALVRAIRCVRADALEEAAKRVIALGQGRLFREGLDDICVSCGNSAAIAIRALKEKP